MKRHVPHRQMWLAAGASLGSILTVSLLGLIILGSRTEIVLPRVQIATVPVGGLTADQVTAKLHDVTQSVAAVTVAVDGSDHTLSLATLGITYDIDATRSAALTLGATGNRLVAGWNRLRGYIEPIQMNPKIDIADATFAKATQDFATNVSHPQTDARLSYTDGAWQVLPSQPGETLDPELVRTAILNHLAQFDPTPIALTPTTSNPHITTAQAEQLLALAKERTAQPVSLTADDEKLTLSVTQLASWTEIVTGSEDNLDVGLNQDKVKAYLKSLAGKINRDPVDAQVSLSDGKVQVVQDSQRGRHLDTNASLAVITKAYTATDGRTGTLPVTFKDPEVTAPTVESLGIKELIGTATTSYIGSPDNRKHNIANGAKFLAGKLVKPSDQFSVVTALGAINDTTGYLPELVIKDNKTEPDFGGGLCQVSTTLFRAAMNAGLKITERTNHSYRVPYYERGVGPGLDATIYLPKPDLKFLNDTPGWILIQSINNPAKNELTFELYGTKDGRTSEVGKPSVYDITQPPPSIYVNSDTIPAGATKQVDHAHAGATTDVTYKVFRAGKVINEQHFHSFYKAWPARYLVGTGTGTPTPSPTTTDAASPSPSPSPTVNETASASPSPTPSATTTSPSPTPSATQTTPVP